MAEPVIELEHVSAGYPGVEILGDVSFSVKEVYPLETAMPLVSKGGTSTIVNCAYIGAILSVSKSAKRITSPTKPTSPTEPTKPTEA